MCSSEHCMDQMQKWEQMTNKWNKWAIFCIPCFIYFMISSINWHEYYKGTSVIHQSEQLTNDIELKTSFSSFFDYVNRELLTECGMAAIDMDINMNGQEQWDRVSLPRPNRGGYAPQLEGEEL